MREDCRGFCIPYSDVCSAGDVQGHGVVRRKTKAFIASAAIAREEQMYASRCSTIDAETGDKDTGKLNAGDKSTTMTSLIHIVETYHLHIFWLTLYTLIVAGIFIERAYCMFTHTHTLVPSSIVPSVMCAIRLTTNNMIMCRLFCGE